MYKFVFQLTALDSLGNFITWYEETHVDDYPDMITDCL